MEEIYYKVYVEKGGRMYDNGEIPRKVFFDDMEMKEFMTDERRFGADKISVYSDTGRLIGKWTWTNGRWKSTLIRKKKKDTGVHPFGL